MTISEYRVDEDIGCALHGSCLTCPEPICVYDFPGGLRAYYRYKEFWLLLDMGMDIDKAAEQLNISRRAARLIYKKTSEKLVLARAQRD